jgi:serine/threonine protein kinase/cell division protein FtsN
MTIATIDGPSTVQIETASHAGAPTVLFVDAVRPSGVPASGGSQAASRAQIEQAISLMPGYGGSVIKMIGNSVLAEFPDPTSAVRVGIEIERLGQQLQQLSLRIGIHTSVGASGLDVFGDCVNWAVGITKHADAGQIFVSRAVYESVSRDTGLQCQWIGKAGLHGRTEEEDIFEVPWAEAPSDIPTRFKVLAQIGAGGMGVVYKVQDLETNEILALKVLKPGIASDPAMQDNLRREVCLARKVTHKNVCRIHEFNRSNGTACISMEFIEGDSLSSRLRRTGSLPAREAIEIARQICAGLREAHVQGIVHRDLKPANVIVDRSGAVKIMDFGIARLMHANPEMTGTISGTPAYMAPEQIEMKSVDARTDIYAIGLLLYEMTAGRPAFSGENPIAVAVKQIRDLPERPREFVPALASHTETIIMKCLQKDPARRFQSVDQLDLALALDTETSVAANSVSSIVPKLQVAGDKVQQIARTVVSEARPALAWWAAELRRESVEARRIARAAAQNVRNFVRQQDWWALTRIRSQQALAGLGLVLVLGCVIAYALGRNGKSGSDALAHPSAGMSASQLMPLPVESLEERRRKTTTQRIDLNRNSVLKPAKASFFAPESGAQTSPSRSRASVLHRSRSSVTGASNAGLSSVDTPVVAAGTAPLEIESEPLASTLEANEPASDRQPAPLKPGSPIYFLEVGSFKDAPWADNAVEKLAQFGFHAISVQKGHLWAQSYHVQVGPYASQKDIDNAQQTLASHGFKGHVVK